MLCLIRVISLGTPSLSLLSLDPQSCPRSSGSSSPSSRAVPSQCRLLCFLSLLPTSVSRRVLMFLLSFWLFSGSESALHRLPSLVSFSPHCAPLPQPLFSASPDFFLIFFWLSAFPVYGSFEPCLRPLSPLLLCAALSSLPSSFPHCSLILHPLSSLYPLPLFRLLAAACTPSLALVLCDPARAQDLSSFSGVTV